MPKSHTTCPKGTLGQKKQHICLQTLSVSHICFLALYAGLGNAGKKRRCERCSHLQALSVWSLVMIPSLQLWPWSVLGIRFLLRLTLLTHEFLTFPDAPPLQDWYCPLLSPVFPVDTPTMHGHVCLMKRYLALCELHVGWHTEHCYGHLWLLYLNDLCFTKANKGCYILKHSLS